MRIVSDIHLMLKLNLFTKNKMTNKLLLLIARWDKCNKTQQIVLKTLCQLVMQTIK